MLTYKADSLQAPGATITTKAVKDSIEVGMATLRIALEEHAKAQEAAGK